MKLWRAYSKPLEQLDDALVYTAANRCIMDYRRKRYGHEQYHQALQALVSIEGRPLGDKDFAQAQQLVDMLQKRWGDLGLYVDADRQTIDGVSEAKRRMADRVKTARRTVSIDTMMPPEDMTFNDDDDIFHGYDADQIENDTGYDEPVSKGSTNKTLEMMPPELQAVAAAFIDRNGRKAEAAKALGIDTRTLNKRLAQMKPFFENTGLTFNRNGKNGGKS